MASPVSLGHRQIENPDIFIRIERDVFRQAFQGRGPGLEGQDLPGFAHRRRGHQRKIADVGAHVPEDLPRVQQTGHQGGFVALVVMPEKINLALFGVLQVQAHAEALIQGHGEQAFARHQVRVQLFVKI